MPEQHLHALPKGHRIEEYEIVRVLGEGSFGITYLAFDHRLDGPVALKEYFPAGFAARADGQRVVATSTEKQGVFAWGLDRFIAEARAIYKFQHPNVVRAHRYVEAHDTAYIVMDYVEGESLEALLKTHGSLSADAWRPWLDRLLDGLAHVHDRGFLHRDIKPTNIVIRAVDEEPVLIDFGAARMEAADRTHTQLLTPKYAPIEQHASQGTRQGPAADIYALAAVSYRVLTGACPPSAQDRMLDDQCKPLAENSTGAERTWLAAIDWGLALWPEDRPQTVAAWNAALREVDAASDPDTDVPEATEAESETVRDAPTANRSSSEDDTQVQVTFPEAAEPADADGLFRNGEMRYYGQGASKNAEKAAWWFRQAAERGHAKAQNRLGLMYAQGEGVRKDYAKAVAWYRRAAEQGHAEARYNLGIMYSYGRGVLKNHAKAEAWFRKACE